MPPINVGIADDEALMRSGLRLIVEGVSDLNCVGEARNGREALFLAKDCDVLLLDLRMPELDGLEALARIQALKNKPKVLVLTAFDTEANVLAALQGGAIGFLLKTTPPLQLIAAIRAAAAEQTLLSPSVLADLLAKASRRNVDPRFESLSMREQEIARLISQGKTNDEIAHELYISLSTVKTHVGRIMDKLGCSNRVQIAISTLEATQQ